MLSRENDCLKIMWVWAKKNWKKIVLKKIVKKFEKKIEKWVCDRGFFLFFFEKERRKTKDFDKEKRDIEKYVKKDHSQYKKFNKNTTT